MRLYETVQGDMFDEIAKKFYGNERRMDMLVEANPQCGDVVVFESGVRLVIPDLPPQTPDSSTLPPWRASS